LPRAGLLEGHECTTHHATIAELKRIAPSAVVRENRLYVKDGDRLTSAGITSGIDLMLHVTAQAARSCRCTCRRSPSRRLSAPCRRRWAIVAVARRSQPSSSGDPSGAGRRYGRPGTRLERAGRNRPNAAGQRLPSWMAALVALFDKSLRDSSTYLGVRRRYDGSSGVKLLGRPLRTSDDALLASARSLLEQRLA
jgi:hypothetical protein